MDTLVVIVDIGIVVLSVFVIWYGIHGGME